MDATSVIIESHAELERAFDAFDRAEGSHHRQIRALRSIAGGLAVHATVEDRVQLGKELLERMHQLQGAPGR